MLLELPILILEAKWPMTEMLSTTSTSIFTTKPVWVQDLADE
jgi:hypothetical protein